MAKRKTSKSSTAKDIRPSVDAETFIPPLFFKTPDKSVAPDPSRGSVTEGMDIIPAFTALIQEGKFVQYLLLRDAIPKHLEPDLQSLWKGFVSEQLGITGKSYNALTIAQGMRNNRHGQTFFRACRKLVWVAKVPRLCTDEEIADGCENCGERRDADGFALVEDTHQWYRKRFHYELGPGVQQFLKGRGPSVQQFRVEEYSLPDLPDSELVEYFTTHPLPAWYRRGITYDIHTVTGPDDEKFPSATIRAVFKYTQDTGIEARYACWAKEFTDEVQECVGRFKEHKELPHELARLVAELQAFNIGDGEAKDFITALGSTTAGVNALNVMRAGKTRLLRKLEELATTATRPAKEWLDLKSLALFLALRYAATKDKDADLPTDGIADRIANAAGHDGKGSGHRLRGYFNSYHSEAGRTGKSRLNSAVLKRYDAVISKLQPYPEALALAQKERATVRNRSHERDE